MTRGGTLVVFGLIALLVTAIVGGLGHLIAESEREWSQFATEHKCKVVSKISGSVFNTFSVDSKGQPVVGVGSTPDKTGYLCDDGVTYYR